jgi:hypothetical protein
MAELPEWAGVALKSDQHAIDIGFAEGAHLRKLGGLREHLNEQRELLERGYPDDRGERNLYHAAWRLGFDAGYLDEEKPTMAILEKLNNYFTRGR